MRLLVVSDTHGDIRGLMAVLSLLGRSVQALVHLGDGAGDVRSVARTGVPMPPAYCVRGNVDGDATMPQKRRIEAEQGIIIAAHGHRYPLGQGVGCLVKAARDEGARAFFFGHTHEPYCEERSGVLILNPGSLSRPRGLWGQSFAVVEAAPGTNCLDAKVFELLGTQARPRFRAIRL